MKLLYRITVIGFIPIMILTTCVCAIIAGVEYIIKGNYSIAEMIWSDMELIGDKLAQEGGIYND